MNTVRDVSQPQEHNELMILNVRMAKDVIRMDGVWRGIMEVVRRLKVKSDDVMVGENEEGHGWSWKSAGVDYLEEKRRKAWRIWRGWEGVGERARVEGENLSVHMHA